MDHTITPREAANHLGISLGALYTLLQNGILRAPPQPPGLFRSSFLRSDDVDALRIYCKTHRELFGLDAQ